MGDLTAARAARSAASAARRRIAVDLHDAGLPREWIARRLGIHRRTVCDYLTAARHREDGTA